MLKKYGTAEPRRVKKKKTERESAGKPASDDTTNDNIRTPRAPKSSTVKTRKLKPGKARRSKAKVSGEDSSDNDEFKPGRARLSREVRALKKENPDFSRYGKEASPSRKRSKKEVKYNEEDCVKGELQSEDEAILNDSLSDKHIPDHAPQPSRLMTDSHAANSDMNSSGHQNTGSLEHQSPTFNMFSNSASYGFGPAMNTPITPSFPNYRMASQPMGVHGVGSTLYATPDSSFSSNDFGHDDFHTHNGRHDSIVGCHEFGNWSNGTYGLQSQPDDSNHRNLMISGSGNVGISAVSNAYLPVSTGPNTLNVAFNPAENTFRKNSHSQLGGLRRGSVLQSSFPNMPITPVTPHTIFSSQPPTPDASPGNCVPMRDQRSELAPASPKLQCLTAPANSDINFDNHPMPENSNDFSMAGFDEDTVIGGIDSLHGFDIGNNVSF